MRVLVVNAGSSTLKLHLVDGDDAVVDEARIDPWDGRADAPEVVEFLDGIGAVDAVGHRVVHGGADLTAPTVVTPEVESRIADLTPLAPLHQPRCLAGLAAARAALPGVPHVACFDTAFHATMPPAARTYALPADWRERWGLARFGFHGLSHAWAVARAPEVAGVAPGGRVVSCHLGAGASLCAAVGGRSVDTTMGFTPLDGIVMATRSGAVDPGIVTWLLTDAGLDAESVADGLAHRSGLLGLAGHSDMRDLLAARDAGDQGAEVAFDVYQHRLRQGIAAMAASAGGLDLLVFTGGVGENAAAVREDAAQGLGFLGVAVDREANRSATGDADISASGASVATVVVTSREELAVAREVRWVLA